MDQKTIDATLAAQLRMTHIQSAQRGLRMHFKMHGGLNRATRRKMGSKYRESYADTLRNYITSVNLGKMRAKQVAAYTAEHEGVQ